MIVDILTTFFSKLKLLFAQTGDNEIGDVENENTEMWSHVGFASRPSKPKPESRDCAQGYVIQNDNHDICIASRDLRGTELLSSLKEGDTALYSGGPDGEGQAKILLQKGSEITLYTTTDGTSGGKACMIRLTGEEIMISNTFGGITINSNGVRIFSVSSGAVGGQVGINGTKVTVTGTKCDLACGNVGLGAAPVLSVVSTASPGSAGPLVLPAALSSTSVFMTP
jgi:hypothetical protein